ERAGSEETDPGAHAVLPPVARAEAMGETLRQPPLDALLGHDDDLLGEGIGQRARQQTAEALGEGVGALCAVEMEGHGPTVSARTDSVWRTLHTVAGLVP